MWDEYIIVSSVEETLNLLSERGKRLELLLERRI